jgi:magnesium chelatase accessory protein
MNWEAARGFWPNARYSRLVEAGPHRWHVQEAGSGPCMLLLHGAGSSTHTWRRLFPELARTFHLVALDLPGQGFSRLGAQDRFGLARMSADIASLLAALGVSPAVIVGHSAGAAIGLRLALDLPASPKAVVCINAALEDFKGPAGAVFPVLAQILAMTPLPAYAFARAARFPSTVRRAIASTGSAIEATGLDLYRWLFMDKGHVDATLCMMANWKLGELVDDLPQLRVPVLFMIGANDHAVPPDTTYRASRRIEAARVEAFPGLGHLLHVEAPCATLRAIRDFLAPIGTSADTPPTDTLA